MFSTTPSDLTSIVAPLDQQVNRSEHPLPTGNHLNWVISGRKGSGKTSILLRALTDSSSPWFKNYNSVFVISPTAKHDPKFAPLLDDIEQSGQGAHYEHLDNEVVDEILEKIKGYNGKYKKKDSRSSRGRSDRDLAHLCIIDDCIHLLPNSHTKKGPSSRVNQLFANNRHSKLTNVITTQQYKRINPLIRANADLITVFPTENRKEMESISADFNLDHDKFLNMLSFATNEPNSFLHVNLFGHKPTYFKKFDKINGISLKSATDPQSVGPAH